MTATVKDMVAAANAAVDTITIEQAAPLVGQPDVLFVDVREPDELRATGRIPGAVHAVRGMLEFYADPASPYHRAELDRDKRIVMVCASGGRSALAARTLKDMGFADVANMIGGMKAWGEAGYPIERAAG